MSWAQLELQYSVLRQRVHSITLGLQQSFQSLLDPKCLRKQSLIQAEVQRIHPQEEALAKFTSIMQGHFPLLDTWAGRAVHVALRMYHHAEWQAGTVNVGEWHPVEHAWSKLYVQMVRLVYIHPEMYHTDHPLPLHTTITLLDTMLDQWLLSLLPLEEAGAPLTSQALRERDDVRGAAAAAAAAAAAGPPSEVPSARSARDEGRRLDDGRLRPVDDGRGVRPPPPPPPRPPDVRSPRALSILSAGDSQLGVRIHVQRPP